MTAIHDSRYLLSLIREGRPISLRQRIWLTLMLSIPAMVAQLSSIVMQYIDAAMVGSLGAASSASIGLVATTTWLFMGLCSAVSTGFSVQVAHKIGADKPHEARQVLAQALLVNLLFGACLAALGVAISGALPHWLGGTADITDNATTYFCIFALALPIMQLRYLASSMLRCSGNMRVPSMLGVVMCVLDVLFNFLLIYPTRTVEIFSTSIVMPGAGMGVCGVALGTAAAEAVATILLLWYLLRRCAPLRLQRGEHSFKPQLPVFTKALRIGFPMGLEHFVICAAQIVSTIIVAPLGVFAIAANSFAVTAESLCYMPGYGIGDAATTLVGISMGAKRPQLMRSFARITVGMGMAIMGVMGVGMYLCAPAIMQWMSPVPEIQSLATNALRIETFAEPMFAASIVAYGVFVGAAHTLVPCIINFACIWTIRLTLAAYLAPQWGLQGVWCAMCIELCIRGALFLWYLRSQRWIKSTNQETEEREQ